MKTKVWVKAWFKYPSNTCMIQSIIYDIKNTTFYVRKTLDPDFLTYKLTLRKRGRVTHLPRHEERD